MDVVYLKRRVPHLAGFQATKPSFFYSKASVYKAYQYISAKMLKFPSQVSSDCGR